MTTSMTKPMASQKANGSRTKSVATSIQRRLGRKNVPQILFADESKQDLPPNELFFKAPNEKKLSRNLVRFAKGKKDARSVALLIIDQSFERDFWAGQNWKVQPANVWEKESGNHRAFHAEKLADFEWRGVSRVATARAVIRFLSDRILIENYEYQVSELESQ
mmetsp:Transcript_15876/g.34818  ORF Transcript_15876/g.34818 Transcript_15876/m.34818 type:complete len:163 (+) Transcript_15876:143-631(+)